MILQTIIYTLGKGIFKVANLKWRW